MVTKKKMHLRIPHKTTHQHQRVLLLDWEFPEDCRKSANLNINAVDQSTLHVSLSQSMSWLHSRRLQVIGEVTSHTNNTKIAFHPLLSTLPSG